MALFEAEPLDRSIPLALYYQVAEALRRQIAAGALKPGDAIPTEEELQSLFGVSRATVRQAVRQLVHDGLLRLERPRGTFVTQPKLQETLAEVISFSDEVRQGGLEPAARVLAVGIEPATEHVAQRLHLQQGDPTLRLDRLRLAGGQPIALMYAHLAGWIGLGAGADYTGSLHALLATRGIRLVDAEQLIEAANASAEHARLLGCRRGSALLKVERVTFSAQGRAIEHVIALYRSDRYVYRIRLGAPAASTGVFR
jgi:GntR family transcriptional regulator, N-acetylglucosamine utilization regulator